MNLRTMNSRTFFLTNLLNLNHTSIQMVLINTSILLITRVDDLNFEDSVSLLYSD